MSNPPLGILGVGHLASYVVAGLRRAGNSHPILLSPRNAERSQTLSARHDCQIAADNQQLVQQCRTILLAVRPAQLDELLSPLEFSDDHLLISCVAGVPLAPLQQLAAPAQVVRTLPLACSEHREGVLPLYPDNASARQLLASLGEVLVSADEDAFELASVAACMNGWVYSWLDQLTGWFTTQGMSQEDARHLVLHTVRGATGLALAQAEQPLGAISDAIATEGTYTRLGLDQLNADQALTAWTEACTRVRDALTD